MAAKSVKAQEKQFVAPDFQAAARASGSRAQKGLAAFLGGMLLFAFTAVTNVDHVLASGNHGPTPPTSEELARLEQHPDIKSLRGALEEVASDGTLGMVKPEIAAQLTAADLANGIAEKWIMSKRVPFAAPQMKKLLGRYSEKLDRTEQLRLASLAAEYGGYDLVSISKLQPEDIIAPIMIRIPVGLEYREKIVESNLLLDTLRNRAFDPRMKDLSSRLNPLQRVVAALAADEFGGTIGHYMAQDAARQGLVDMDMINSWREAIQWSVADVTGVTPIQILARRPDILTKVFPADSDAVLVAVDKKAWEQMVLSHSVLDQSDEVLHAIVTPDFLLSSPSGDGRTVASKLRPECLEKYLTPRVMGRWTEDQVREIWNAINPSYRHDSGLRRAYQDVVRLVKNGSDSQPSPAQAPAHQPG